MPRLCAGSRSTTVYRVMGTITRAAASFFLAATLALASCSRPPIVIGFSGQFSGRMAEVGVAARNGALLAVDEIDRSGGLGGRRVVLESRDDRGDPALAPKVDKELIDAGAVAIVGHLTSTLTLAARSVAEEAGTVVVSPWASSSALLEPGAKFFMVFSSSDEEAIATAGHAYVRSRCRTAFVVKDASNAAYTERWTGRFSSAFEEAGGKVVGESSFASPDQAGLFEAADRAAASRADAVILAADVLDVAMLCQRLRMRETRARLYASNWAMAEELLANGGRAVEGLTIFSNIDKLSDEPRSAAFRAAYEKRFGASPHEAAYLGYEAVSVILAAWPKAGSRKGLGEAIAGSGPYRGLQCELSFGALGEARRPLLTFVVKDGRFGLEGR